MKILFLIYMKGIKEKRKTRTERSVTVSARLTWNQAKASVTEGAQEKPKCCEEAKRGWRGKAKSKKKTPAPSSIGQLHGEERGLLQHQWSYLLRLTPMGPLRHKSLIVTPTNPWEWNGNFLMHHILRMAPTRSNTATHCGLFCASLQEHVVYGSAEEPTFINSFSFTLDI